ncbi:hypothetical protein ACBP93_08100 [Paenalcaligenes hominis]|uniref:Uncharacterized protein n=1 Tax=Paenalcaligenes hominis TaxID=643674 RepID=A0A1U9JXH4_9BURK|nr:hypothetical protein [Paenalcaligenes hominis]AQS50472.1 hypothetical protein PAEH1_01015 [Paenalcaligenes hominis]NJB65792.1 hypothetical protein [Paenalcaligenes hominis]GGE69784.1 hypothetical protein GCM10007278_17310 [Paenalcaligenes hominis]
MLLLESREREYLLEICALTEDQNNNLVFVGMTLDDSIWYYHYLESSFKGMAHRDAEHEARYIALQTAHEQERCSILAADSLLRPLVPVN